MTKFAKIMLAVCLVAMLMCLVGCEDKPEPTTTVPQTTVGTMDYTITVKTPGGLILRDVTVYVYESAEERDLVDTPKKLDASGSYKFTAPISSSYVFELDGVPAGYDVQEQYTIGSAVTEVELVSAPIDGEIAEGTIYKMGDIIHDYSFTGMDGKTYTISELLKEKNAVVLNFWYVNCGFCKDEFPYLQNAYEKHSDKVEVLGLNVEPGDTVEEIDGVVEDYGLTFPIARADTSLLFALRGTACPTTVVIDRYGMISFVYTGGIEDPAHFPALLRHFGEAQQQGIVEPGENVKDTLDKLVSIEDIPYGCVQYPYGVGAFTEYQAEVRANELVYYTMYRSSHLLIEDPDVYLVMDGQKYYPVDGVLEMEIVVDDFYQGVNIALGTTGGVDKQIIMRQIPPMGSSENPIIVELGELVLAVDGVDKYYAFTAEHTGTFTITIENLPAGVVCRANMTNMRTYTVTEASSEDFMDPETGLVGTVTFTISVEAGDTVRIIFGASSENTENVEIQALASIPEVEGSGTSAYSVVITDEMGVPVPDVTITVMVAGVPVTHVTDAEGKVLMEMEAGTYPVTLTVPEGYFASTQYLLTPAKKELNVVLEIAREYTVQVSVLGGEVLPGVEVQVFSSAEMDQMVFAGVTDENGLVTFVYGNIEGCVAVLIGIPNNVLVHKSYALTGELTQIELISTSDGDANAAGQSYRPGDQMLDFLLTASDGTSYTLNEVLQQKKAVVLAFWNSTDPACKSVLTALQNAYEIYGEKLEILAMNPLDKSDMTIDLYKSLLGLTFPAAQCSTQWESAIHITAYPTLVIVDRNGTVCLVQGGTISDETLLQKVLELYTAEDYQTTIANSMQELFPSGPQQGTVENPIVVEAGTFELTLQLDAGEAAYFTVQDLAPLGIRAECDGLYIIYHGEHYDSVDGVLQLEINIAGEQEPATLVIGNAGTESVTITIVFTPLSAG